MMNCAGGSAGAVMAPSSGWLAVFAPVEIPGPNVGGLAPLSRRGTVWRAVAVRLALAGKAVIDADAGLEATRLPPHGHVAAIVAWARALGFPALLGPPCRGRDLAFALIISRVARPASKVSTISWWDDVTLGPDLGVAGASTDEVYDAMDWPGGPAR